MFNVILQSCHVPNSSSSLDLCVNNKKNIRVCRAYYEQNERSLISIDRIIQKKAVWWYNEPRMKGCVFYYES